jgi:UDP-N-acetylglucosamine 2-epimerase (non-hydrolysing)
MAPKNMKVMTILGTRPEIIRLSLIIPRLDAGCDHKLVHTGQNYDPALSDRFFQELRVRKPDHHLGVEGASFGQQIGQILERTEALLKAERPDRVLILGDTNSALSAIIAKRMGIPVFHMEAGNRCFDDRVPEEVNRRIIDHASDVLMPYTERSRDCLLREGIPSNRIFVVGNPIREVLLHYASEPASDILARLKVEPGRYMLATLHRAESVDRLDILKQILAGFSDVAGRAGMPIILSVHPRTRSRLDESDIGAFPGVQFHDPFGLSDFIGLMRKARCVLTDSGTVQEECAILAVPNVTVRETTERPETLECGSNILAGVSRPGILRAVDVALSAKHAWSAPREYLAENVSDIVARIVLGHHLGLPVPFGDGR